MELPTSSEYPTTGTRRDFLKIGAGLSLAGLSLASPFALAGSGTSALQTDIQRYVRSLRQQGVIKADERTAWSVYDFSSGQKLVSINENVPYQSASMLKPFIAQAYFVRHRQNPSRYPYDTQVRTLMEKMIRYSSNSATNELIRRCGRGKATRPQDVERLLKDVAGPIFRELSLVEFIPRNGRTYRNRASARDYSRFLYALWNNNLPHADDIKYYMGLPNADRIRRGVAVIPAFTPVYDKTGSTAMLCGDMGILAARGQDGRDYPYTMIGIIEKSRRTRSYRRWLRRRSNVIRDVSALAYRHMSQRYPLV